MSRLALLLMAASGFAGLGYQIVWTQQFGLVLGHESAAVLAVVAAFFGGLSLGALLLGRRIEASARPLRWYAGCEALIGLWGGLLMLAMPAASGAALALIGPEATPLRHWCVAFGASFVLLLPATTAMGATLPAMARLGTTHLPPLYAANTLGAVAGVLGTAFWLIPGWGLTRCAGLCVALNLGCAALAGLALQARPTPPLGPRTSSRPLALLALTGLLGISYEVLAVRVLSQVAEDTVYTFALLLAVYLAGSALGAAAFTRWQRLCSTPLLLKALAWSILLGMAALWSAEAIKAWLQPETQAAALATEALLAVAAFALPTLLMGALFCQLSADAAAAGIPFSRALGANTLGAMVAAPLFGVALAPVLGPKLTLLLVAAGYLLLTPAWRRPSWWLPAGATAALALLAPPLAFVDLPEGGRLLSYRDGAMAAVSVVEDAAGIARLRINNRQQEGSSATLLVDGRQALLPLLLHGEAGQALFLGVGSGVTAGVAARLPGLRVDAVELLPEVIQAATLFRHALAGLGDGPEPRLLAADARRFVRTATQRYDVVVSDNFHPARSGSGALYTVEHFHAVRERLAPRGLFCQWLPLHQLDLDTLRSITAAFLQAFPDGAAILASNSLDTPTVGLVGRAGGTRFGPRPPPALAASFGLDDELAVLGSLIADPRSLQRFAAGAPPNTDDRPWVAYSAPRVTYAPDSAPRDRLLDLLGLLNVDTTALLAEPGLAPRLNAYARARHGYLDLGRRTQPSADPAVMLARVGAPLLAVLRQSPDFQPAAEPLRRIAQALAPRDPAAARQLLDALARIRPDLVAR
ncbi:spermidine synthase [Roseateles sp.]|uniref:spermine/spermidine synthase domain-containing protein n=1 Tax=Roseateles sp. TaxID=1971397 RepID=UPI0025F41C1E|nr:spermidine synthase [Roseateles sp.]MBV8036172.1 spermidine synthase [Roseateles sp.]